MLNLWVFLQCQFHLCFSRNDQLYRKKKTNMIIKTLLYRIYFINDIILNGIVFRKFMKINERKIKVELTIYFNTNRFNLE